MRDKAIMAALRGIAPAHGDARSGRIKKPGGGRADGSRLSRPCPQTDRGTSYSGDGPERRAHISDAELAPRAQD